MPRIAELAARIIDLVARETEVTTEDIMSRRRVSEIVDARHLAVALMRRRNIYPPRIAAILGMSPRSVHYAISNFDNRLSQNRLLRMSYERLKREVEE